MTETFDLNKMGLAPMNEIEMQEVDGGFPWYPALAIVAGCAAIICTGGMALAAGGVAVCATGLSN